MSGPILVTGADRSGTTLLYALLASHPDVAMVRRSNLWRWFDQAFGPLDDEANLEACLDRLSRYERLDVLAPDVDRLRDEFRLGEPTYGALFRLLFEHHAQRVGAPRWGDKSLHTEHDADRVFEEWPDARIVHMIRDPRDRHASVIRRYPDREKGVGSITGRWVASADRARINEQRYPDRYLVLCYETLAREPAVTTSQVCDFVGLAYTDAMLGLGGVAGDAEHGNSSFGRIPPGTISTGSIGRHTDVLDPVTIAVIEGLTEPHLTRFGYARHGAALSGLQRARLAAVDLPLARLRMNGWLRVALPRDLERGVPDERLRAPAA